MQLANFYNSFHKNSKVQKNVIQEKNFTYRIVISVLKGVINNRKNLRILDYGCGVGTVAIHLASKGNYITGVDISKKAINSANESATFLGLQKLAKFYTLPLGIKKIAKKKFDLIICIEVIEHIKEDKKLIKLLSGHLKRTGVLVVSTPSDRAPLHKLGLTRNFDKKVGHLRRYNPEKLITLTEKCGLKTVRIKKTEGILRNSLYVIPVLGKLVRFLKGPISDFVTFLDNITIPLFGESDLFILTQKQ